MVRWRLCLALAIMLLLPIMLDGKNEDDDDDDRRSEDSDDDEEEEEEEDDESVEEKGGGGMDKSDRRAMVPGRHAPLLLGTPKAVTNADQRSSKRRPLECFVCAFKSETPLRACLDPTKFRVHTITCHSADDKCFTSVTPKGDSYEAVVRGCRSGCVGSAETTCCEANRCNNQAFAMPVIQAATKVANKPLKSKSSKCDPPSIMFFITVLLIQHVVGKVASV